MPPPGNAAKTSIVTAHCFENTVFILTDDGALHTIGNGNPNWTRFQLKHVFESIEYARFSPDADYMLILGSYPLPRHIGDKYDCECGWSVFDMATKREIKLMRTGIQNSPYDDHFEDRDGPTIADTGAFVSFDRSNSYFKLIDKHGEANDMATSKLMQTYNEVGDTQNNTTRGERVSISSNAACVIVHCTTTYDDEDIPKIHRIELFFTDKTVVLPISEPYEMASCITNNNEYAVIGSMAWTKAFDISTGTLMYAISHDGSGPSGDLRMVQTMKTPHLMYAKTSDSESSIDITVIRRALGEDEVVYPRDTLLRRNRVMSYHGLYAMNENNAVVVRQTKTADGKTVKEHGILTRYGWIVFPDELTRLNSVSGSGEPEAKKQRLDRQI